MHAVLHVVRYIELTPEVEEHVSRCRKEKLCFACEESLSGKVVRHTHENCYKALMRTVERGEETVESLVEKGLFAGKEVPGRKPNHKSLKRLNRAS